MSKAEKLAEVIIRLNDAEEEVISIANSIKQVRHDHAVAIAGLEELLEQAQGDLAAAQHDGVMLAAQFARSMEVEA
jgi:hypothetical protein